MIEKLSSPVLPFIPNDDRSNSFVADHTESFEDISNKAA